MTIVIARLLPELLSINGSLGNSDILASTLARMGNKVNVVDLSGVGDVAITPDVVCVGSGSTSALQPALTALVPIASALHGWAQEGAAFCAIGMGWDVLGQDITVADGGTLPGIGIFPSSADYRPGRFAGEVAGVDYKDRDTAGYINQVGTTTLHDGTSLMTITRQAKPVSPKEGIVHGPLFGTKLGGPALSLNPHLRDDVIDTILARLGLGSVAECQAPGFQEFHSRTHHLAAAAREKIRQRLR
jgi:lipid II isoglutaminyl synthase (glutamine-hydrolysing)